MNQDIINKALAYIGKKIDDITNAVKTLASKETSEVDFSETNKRLEQIKDTLNAQTIDLMRALPNQKDTAGMEEAVKSLREVLMSFSQKENPSIEIPDTTEMVQNNHNELYQAISNQIDILTAILNKKEDDSNIIKSLNTLNNSIESIHIEPNEVDISPVVDEQKTANTFLKKLFDFVSQKNTASIEEKIDNGFNQLIAAIKNIKLDQVKTIKLDEMQMRTLANSGSGGLHLKDNYIGSASKVTIANVALTSTSVEYSYTFPTGTVAWSMKLRDQGTLFYYAYTTGKLPSSGDSSAYITVPQNFVQSKDGVDWSSKTIYVGAESASQVLELTVFKS